MTESTARADYEKKAGDELETFTEKVNAILDTKWEESLRNFYDANGEGLGGMDFDAFVELFGQLKPIVTIDDIAELSGGSAIAARSGTRPGLSGGRPGIGGLGRFGGTGAKGSSILRGAAKKPPSGGRFTAKAKVAAEPSGDWDKERSADQSEPEDGVTYFLGSQADFVAWLEQNQVCACVSVTDESSPPGFDAVCGMKQGGKADGPGNYRWCIRANPSVPTEDPKNGTPVWTCGHSNLDGKRGKSHDKLAPPPKQNYGYGCETSGTRAKKPVKSTSTKAVRGLNTATEDAPVRKSIKIAGRGLMTKNTLKGGKFGGKAGLKSTPPKGKINFGSLSKGSTTSRVASALKASKAKEEAEPEAGEGADVEDVATTGPHDVDDDDELAAGSSEEGSEEENGSEEEAPPEKPVKILGRLGSGTRGLATKSVGATAPAKGFKSFGLKSASKSTGSKGFKLGGLLRKTTPPAEPAESSTEAPAESEPTTEPETTGEQPGESTLAGEIGKTDDTEGDI